MPHEYWNGKRVKLCRWFYCKYCYKSIRPEIGDGVVICPCCHYGLAPLDEVIEAGSLGVWYASLVKRFNEKYGQRVQ
jgi:hypothetical protein